MNRHIRSIDTGFEEDEYLFIYDFEEYETPIEYNVFVNNKKYKVQSPVKLESLMEYKTFVRQVALAIPDDKINVKIEQSSFFMVKVGDSLIFNDFENEPAICHTNHFSKTIIEHWKNGKHIF
jgi:hypothetical protein